ncbi:MAG TPA: acyl-CoA dehydrogenase family protein [Pirellulales bacterium]|jgi:alkylation response protein AidB-like acyl-CoA dehydrogenase|nr:acyl-CoA dehydrogenase family protein [Pirellulales bacterium]
MHSPTEQPPVEQASFAETALKLGGKSEEESRRTGAIDRADDQVEALFAPQYQTTASPAHRAVWENEVPVKLFASETPNTPPEVTKVMDASLAIAARHRAAGTLMDSAGKITDAVFQELGAAGYWGLLVDREYGGSGAAFASFAPFLTRMATIDPTVAGLASVHGCIGAVDPVRAFGNAEQKSWYLPGLANGSRLSAFALTEPGAGSDLTALRTRAVLDGDAYVVNGEKLFITNVVPGRTIGLVCLIDDRPAVLVVELPNAENEHFQLKKYGLYALKHAYNQGIIFRDFRVPAANLLRPARGDGLTIAYHGLNLGRVALCAASAGNMRLMLAGMLPWARFRKTYGAAIASRELVRRRVARLAGLIVASDALVAWCSGLIDQGYRGEMECIIAKIFGSEAQKEAAIELMMKTHGGRAFLHGHMFGDNVHEFLAPCIYEGEGEMLGMAFFKSLVKQHGTQFFEPIGKTLAAAGIKKPNLANPAHAWALREPLWQYSKWFLGQKIRRHPEPELPKMPPALQKRAEFAVDWLGHSALEISGLMRKYQLALADRQCRMAEVSLRVQDAIIMLCTSLYAARQSDTLVHEAADCFCDDLQRKLTGRRPSDRYLRNANRLGASIADGGFAAIAGIAAGEIMMPYANE